MSRSADRPADPGPDGGDHGPPTKFPPPPDASAPPDLTVVTVLKASGDGGRGRGQLRRNGAPTAKKWDSGQVGSKLEVDNSRRSVDGTRRYELSSRSKSPLKLENGRPPSPSTGIASQSKGPVANAAMVQQLRIAQPHLGVPQQRRSVPIVHPNRSPSPHSRRLRIPSSPADPHLPHAVAPGDRVAFNSPAQGPQHYPAHNSQVVQQQWVGDGQNCNPNAHKAETHADGRSINGKHAQDMRGRMNAVMQNPVALQSNDPSSTNSPPLKPFWCQDLFSSSPIKSHVQEGKSEGQQEHPMPEFSDITDSNFDNATGADRRAALDLKGVAIYGPGQILEPHPARRLLRDSIPTRRALVLPDKADAPSEGMPMDLHYNVGDSLEQAEAAIGCSSLQADGDQGQLKQATPSLESIDIREEYAEQSDCKAEEEKMSQVLAHREKEEVLCAENLGLRQRVMALELDELKLQTENSTLKQCAAELERKCGELQASIGGFAKIQELEAEVLRLRENRESAERSKERGGQFLGSVETSRGQDIANEASVMHEGNIALLESQVADCERQLVRRDMRIADLERQLAALQIVKHGEDKKIAELTREVEALQIVKSGKQMSEMQEELARVQDVNDELRKQIFDLNVCSAREENRLQDACSAVKRQEEEMIALRARRKELQRSLTGAHMCASELMVLIEGAVHECEAAQEESRIVFRDLWRESNGGTTLVAAANLILELSVNGNLCDAIVQTQPWDRLNCAECGGGRCDLQQDDEDATQILQELLSSARSECENTKDRMADLERRYRGLETTMEWLASERDAADEKCTDLQLMCVAYREKVQLLEKTVSDQQDGLSSSSVALDERDARLGKMRNEMAVSMHGRRQEEAALAAAREELQEREVEVMKRIQETEAASDLQKKEYESRIKELDIALAEEQARLQILEADNTYQNEVRRELAAKVQELQSRSLDSKMQTLHTNQGTNHTEGDGPLEVDARNRLHVAYSNLKAPQQLEIKQTLSDASRRVGLLRIVVAEFEASSARVAHELRLVQTRAQRLEMRLGAAERARIAAEIVKEGRGIICGVGGAGNCRPKAEVAEVSVAAEVEVFRNIALQGDMNKLVAMYEMAKEEGQISRQAAGEGIQALHALQAQRIANVEMEAKISLLQEEKAAAEAELVVAQRVMSMRATVDRQGGLPVASDHGASPLSSGLDAVEELLYSAQRSLQAFQPEQSVGGGDRRDRSGDHAMRARIQSMSPLVRMHAHDAGGGASSRGEPATALVLVDKEEERQLWGEAGVGGESAYPASQGSATGRVESLAARHRDDNVAGRRPGHSTAASVEHAFSASLPIAMPSTTCHPAISDRRRKLGNGHVAQGNELEWGVRSGGIYNGQRGRDLPVVRRDLSPCAPKRGSPTAGSASAGGGGGDALQRTLEIRRMLGR